MSCKGKLTLTTGTIYHKKMHVNYRKFAYNQTHLWQWRS